jgi:AbiV family abortive infection protein
MNYRTFTNISQEECQQYYPKTLENAQRKWQASEDIAASGDYGTAVSLAIVSIEELVKTVILSLDSNGFRFRKIRGVETLFRNHQIRYFVSYLMFIINIIGEEFVSIIKKYVDNPEQFEIDFKNIKDDEEAFYKRIEPYLKEKIKMVKTELDWFAKIDLFRQDGFYSDFQDVYKDPIHISHEQYLEVIGRLRKVRMSCLMVIEFNKTNDSSSETMVMVQNSLNKANAYNNIAGLLKIVKTADRKDPFFLVRKYYEERAKIENPLFD